MYVFLCVLQKVLSTRSDRKRLWQNLGQYFGIFQWKPRSTIKNLCKNGSCWDRDWIERDSTDLRSPLHWLTDTRYTDIDTTREFAKEFDIEFQNSVTVSVLRPSCFISNYLLIDFYLINSYSKIPYVFLQPLLLRDTDSSRCATVSSASALISQRKWQLGNNVNRILLCLHQACYM
jgi:hypothetical protein